MKIYEFKCSSCDHNYVANEREFNPIENCRRCPGCGKCNQPIRKFNSNY